MYRPRLTADDLVRIHGTAEAAFAVADFFSTIRLADGDPVLTGMALVMLGHERRGLALLEGEPALPHRARLVQALGLWLTGDCDPQARALAADCVSQQGRHGPAAALLRAMDQKRPHIAFYCTAANTLRAADLLKASDEAKVSVLRNVPAKADIAFAPDTPAERLVAAFDAPVDCVFIDNLLMLPPQLAAIPAPKIAQVFDIEFSYAQRARELGWLDLIVTCGNSTEHMCARTRFGDQVMMRGQPLDELLDLDVDPADLQEQAATADRPIDALITGGIDKPFYGDKKERYGALAQADPDLDIRLVGRYLPFERYRALTARTKYTVQSSRTAHIVTRRAIETLTAGTMLVCEQDHGLHLLFGDSLKGVHSYRDGHIARDIARLVAAFPRHQTEFVASIPALVEGLRSLYPRPDVAARRSIRYLTFWTEMAKARMGWRAVAVGTPVARRRHVVAPTPADCYAAKQESWLGLPPALRGRLLGALARADTDAALAMPRLGQTVTAQAFMALNERNADLFRDQAEGQARARLDILHTLNRARRRHPRSLATWFLIGKHLAEIGRFLAAKRVLTALTDRSDELELEPRVTMVDTQYEVNDWPFVDAVAADDLARAYPEAMGPCHERARSWILGRAHALIALMSAISGDAAAWRSHGDRALAHAGRDLGVLEHVYAGAIHAWQADGGRTCLARAAAVALAAMRLSPQFLFDRLPEVIRILGLLERPALADLTVRTWLRTKARIRLAAETPLVSDDERQLFRVDPALFTRNAAAFDNTRLQPTLDAIAADLGHARQSRDAA